MPSNFSVSVSKVDGGADTKYMVQEGTTLRDFLASWSFSTDPATTDVMLNGVQADLNTTLRPDDEIRVLTKKLVSGR